MTKPLRKESIKSIDDFMQRLLNAYDAKSKRQLYYDYKEHIEHIEPEDIFRLALYQDDDTRSIETIKQSANRFVNVFKTPLKKHEITSHNHPYFKAVLEENRRIIKHLDKTKQWFKTGTINNHITNIKEAFEAMEACEKKFQKTENILFSNLEGKLPSQKPLSVLWSLHDDARRLRKTLMKHLDYTLEDETTFKKFVGDYYYLIYGLIEKEQLILYPVASKVLDDKTLDGMYKETFVYGFAFLTLTPPDLTDTLSDQSLKTPSGTVSTKQFVLMMDHLPVDITLVDKNDRVTYFNNRKDRHFPRSPSIIGRDVHHCHPPKSVDIVHKILQAFKEGTRNHARFHIHFKDKFLLIDYYALRDKKGNYEGVLEISQNILPHQSIKEEKRLLDWQ